MSVNIIRCKDALSKQSLLINAVLESWFMHQRYCITLTIVIVQTHNHVSDIHVLMFLIDNSASRKIYLNSYTSGWHQTELSASHLVARWFVLCTLILERFRKYRMYGMGRDFNVVIALRQTFVVEWRGARLRRLNVIDIKAQKEHYQKVIISYYDHVIKFCIE